MVALAIIMMMPLCFAAAAISDVSEMSIPNTFSAFLMISFLVLAPLFGFGWEVIGMNVLAGLTVFAGVFLLFAMNVMGGGDAKLLTAAAFWYGFGPPLVEFLAYTAFVGGAVTIVILMVRAHACTILAMGIALPRSLTTANKIPYGLAIAIAGFLTYENAPIVKMAMLSLG